MNSESAPSSIMTADFRYIDIALRSRWPAFRQLSSEVENFEPKTRQDFSEHRHQCLAHMKGLNPTATDEELLLFIDSQIESMLPREWQIAANFSDRAMSEYVTVAFLSHALTEATINAILAIGLASAGTEDLFSLLARSSVIEKWLSGPKAFHPAWTFPTDGALYETFLRLTRQRNSLVHYKVEMEIAGEVKLQGTKVLRGDIAKWITRYFSLPYDLVEYATRSLPFARRVMIDRGPIQRYEPHSRPT